MEAKVRGAEVARTGAREAALVALGTLALAVAATWPLVLQASIALPSDLGDPLLNTFILGWNADRFAHGLTGYWNAPFFFPYHATLAFSEHLFGIAIFTAPIQWITGNPVLVYNVAMLGSYVLAGLGMYLLARDLWGRRDAAWVAAVAFAFAPYRVMHVPHLQVLVSGWMPVGLWCLHRYLRSGSRRALTGFVAAFLQNGHSNGYFLYFFSVAVVIVGVPEALRALAASRAAGALRRRMASLSIDVVAAVAVIGAAVAPFAAAYGEVRRSFGLARSVSEMGMYSGHLGDYLAVPGQVWFWRGLLGSGEGERSLFPGLLTTAVALAAVGWLVPRRNADRAAVREARRATVLYTVLVVAAVWLSLGPSALPYRLLLQVLPGFDGLRVPARFAIIAALGLAVLAGGGFAWFRSWLGPRAGAATAAALSIALVIESAGWPFGMTRFDPWQRVRAEANAWLRQAPPGGVLELPVAPFGGATFAEVQEYNTLFHGHPIVNGYSGYDSPLQRFLTGPGSPLVEAGAMPHALEALSSIGVRYVVVAHGLDGDLPGWHRRATEDAIASAGRILAEEQPFTAFSIWRLTAPAPAPPEVRVPMERLAWGRFDASASTLSERLSLAFDNRLDTRWTSRAPQRGDEWIRLDFPETVDLARLAFGFATSDLPDYARQLSVIAQDGDGTTRTLFEGSVLPGIVGSLADQPRGPVRAVIDLPRNLSRAVIIRQLGRSDRWYWSVDELEVYRRW